MKESYYFLILIISIITLSCGDVSEDPEQVFYKMRSYACAGNKRGFYSHIDKASVEQNFKKSVLQSMKADGADEKEIEELNPDAVKDMVEIVIPNILILKWELINQQIARGDIGAVCNLEVIGKLQGGKVLELQYPDGSRSDWGFEKKSDGFALISISDSSPLEIIGKRWDIDSIMRNKVRSETEPSVSPPSLAKEIVNRDQNRDDNINEPYGSNEQLKTDDDSQLESHDQENVIAQDKSAQKSELIISERDQPSNETGNVSISPRQEKKPKAVEITRGHEDFGRARWGMGSEQVISARGSEPYSEQSGVLKYNDIYLGMSSQISYIFTNDRLVKGIYRLFGNKGDENYYFQNYIRIKELLSLKYGAPTTDEEVWINSLYKNNPDRHGFALQIGHLSYKTRWSTKRTNVLLELKRGNSDTLLEAYFISK